MELESIIILAGLIFMAAILYSSVGHAGASGYLAAMALFGMVPIIVLVLPGPLLNNPRLH